MVDELQWRLALLILLLVGIGASVALRRRANRVGGRIPRSVDEPRVAAALKVAGIVYYGALLLWLIHPPTVAWASVSLPAGSRWAGVAIAAAGLALGLWTLWHLGRNVTPTAIARPEAELVTSGPYHRVRHPLYTSMLLSIPGFTLVTANLLVLAGGAATFAVISVRTRREEEELLNKFGDRYAEYAERTGRFLPRIG